MRKSLAVALSALMLTFGVPTIGGAQAANSSLRGQVVDAGGLGARDMRVELVKDGYVIATTISTVDGHFNFAGVPAGSYVVRTLVNGMPTGVRVAVTERQADNALLVLPSIAKAAPAGVLVALGTSALGSLVTVAVTVVGSQVFVQAQEEADEEFIQEKLSDIPALLQELNEQISNTPGLPPAPVFNFIPASPTA